MADTLAALYGRVNAVMEPAVTALAGWIWHDVPPDATDTPAAWLELSTGQMWLEDANLFAATFTVYGALHPQPAAPSTAAEVAFIDAVMAASRGTPPVNYLNTVASSWRLTTLDVGAVTHRAVAVDLTFPYSPC